MNEFKPIFYDVAAAVSRWCTRKIWAWHRTQCGLSGEATLAKDYWNLWCLAPAVGEICKIILGAITHLILKSTFSFCSEVSVCLNALYFPLGISAPWRERVKTGFSLHKLPNHFCSLFYCRPSHSSLVTQDITSAGRLSGVPTLPWFAWLYQWGGRKEREIKNKYLSTAGNINYLV